MEPDIKPLADCLPAEVWPTDTAPYQVHVACLFHGTHRVAVVDMPVMRHWMGLDVQVGVTLQPVSEICSPECGPAFLAYKRGMGPECHCLDTPGPSTT